MRYENFLPHNRLIINSGGIHKPTLKLCGGECWRDERAPGRSLLCFAYADEELLNWVSNELQVLNVSISGCGGVPVVFPSVLTQQVGRTIGECCPTRLGTPTKLWPKEKGCQGNAVCRAKFYLPWLSVFLDTCHWHVSPRALSFCLYLYGVGGYSSIKYSIKGGLPMAKVRWYNNKHDCSNKWAIDTFRGRRGWWTCE